ncbi:MAG TPA: Omp28 family outer membrane lipoprotein [Bacteroidales bacterium]|nr:Omp28 family outer membrane lipoprotein [Bacteroidales bacterium]
MKKILYTLPITLLLTGISWMFSSCDKIDEPYVVKKEVVDTTQCPVPEFPAVTNPVKRALLEDYTGHSCVNCPRAAVTAHELMQQYGNSLVVVAVHAGFFAKPANAPLNYDFRTTAGTDWDDFFGIGKVGNPNGMVDRAGYPSEYILSPSAWGNAIANELGKSPVAELQLMTDYDPATTKLCIHTKTSFLQSISNKAVKLSVIIVEDSIVAAQKNNDAEVGATPLIEDYVHMHVMRGAVNGSWGDQILASSCLSGDPVIKSYQTSLNGFNANPIDAEHCRVIAFLYDAATYEVLQVTEKAITE